MKDEQAFPKETMSAGIPRGGMNQLGPAHGGRGVMKCPEVGTQAHTHWRKCWVAFFSCRCWLDSGHMPGAPEAHPMRS